MKNLFTLTPSAVDQVKTLIKNRSKTPAGIRVNVQTKGCSGLSYSIEYADLAHHEDEIVEQDGVTVMIAPQATLFVAGTVMDFVSDKFQSGFVFKNPNEKGKCGCGKSFFV
jgi:iron-sulfur cluster assembly protein